MSGLVSNKEKYRVLCDNHPEIPLFAQYWWMDAICVGKEWDVLLVEEEGAVLGAMPYLMVRKFLFKLILQPIFSQNNGVHFFYPKGMEEDERETFERFVCQSILTQLEAMRLDWYMQYFDPTFRHASLWRMAGYDVTERVTYVIPSLRNLVELFGQFTPAKKRHIRKAERSGLAVRWDMEPAAFYDFHTECLRLRGRSNINSRQVEENLIRQALDRGQGKILSIHDSEGNLHSALFFVWNDQYGYYLIPAIHPTYKASGASTLMVWRTLQFLQNKTQSFDFEGSMDPQIAHSYKQFATERVVYNKVEKVNSSLLRCYLGCRGNK